MYLSKLKKNRRCEICDSSSVPDQDLSVLPSQMQIQTAPVSISPASWSCPACTFANSAIANRCEICDTANPSANQSIVPVCVSAASMTGAWFPEWGPDSAKWEFVESSGSKGGRVLNLKTLASTVSVRARAELGPGIYSIIWRVKPPPLDKLAPDSDLLFIVYGEGNSDNVEGDGKRFVWMLKRPCEEQRRTGQQWIDLNIGQIMVKHKGVVAMEMKNEGDRGMYEGIWIDYVMAKPM